MTRKNHKVFLDTSVVFSAILSPAGGARKLFLLGEAGFLTLIVGPNVLRECDDVVRRKSPSLLPTLAQLLSTGQVQTCDSPTAKNIEDARELVAYSPDARVLAEAMVAMPDWFITHDKEHFLKVRSQINLPFQIATPGDLLQAIKDDFIAS
jgi:predicted nucleic acid-binding protein